MLIKLASEEEEETQRTTGTTTGTIDRVLLPLWRHWNARPSGRTRTLTLTRDASRRLSRPSGAWRRPFFVFVLFCLVWFGLVSPLSGVQHLAQHHVPGGGVAADR